MVVESHGSGRNCRPVAIPEVVWLGEPEAGDVSLVGGKAANLSQLAAVHQVPPGFCLTTEAYARAGGTNIPSNLEQQIRRAYQSLGQRVGMDLPPVAVRSSAVDEDGAQTSFAGQHETYLNIVGAEAVSEAVARCWASLRTERALEYRRLHGLTLDGIRLAVLVQRLIVADVSAVVFSANPISGNPDEIMINASWGLGESIVGGTVTPDTFAVRKHDLAILNRRRGDKGRMTVMTPEGTREVEVPRLLREQLTLSDDQVCEMGRLARTLEATFGWPVDVECAWQNNQLFLLQCRRITTLTQ